jgi:hypothetical protein
VKSAIVSPVKSSANRVPGGDVVVVAAIVVVVVVVVVVGTAVVVGAAVVVVGRGLQGGRMAGQVRAEVLPPVKAGSPIKATAVANRMRNRFITPSDLQVVQQARPYVR